MSNLPDSVDSTDSVETTQPRESTQPSENTQLPEPAEVFADVAPQPPLSVPEEIPLEPLQLEELTPEPSTPRHPTPQPNTLGGIPLQPIDLDEAPRPEPAPEAAVEPVAPEDIPLPAVALQAPAPQPAPVQQTVSEPEHTLQAAPAPLTPLAPASEPAALPPAAPQRLVSLDAYRGLAMLMMASEGLGISRVAEHFKNNPLWQKLAFHTEHVAWTGCALWDMIQPSFMFIVGVALPFSLTSRKAKGQSFNWMLFHAILRALALIGLGIFLRSVNHSQTYFTFEDVLTQIGLGYVFLFLLAWTRPRTQAIAVAAILVLYWAAFAVYPKPDASFDYATVGVAADWPHLQGFAAHWDKNTNLAARFDQWFLNLFPRKNPFVYNGGGYLTLNFIPSLATMIFGLLAGQLLLSSRRGIIKILLLLGGGTLGVALGMGLDLAGICPIVKRIWTPSWAIYSAGWACLALAVFYTLTDLVGWRKWTLPLLVVGMNSIAMYCMAHLIDGFIRESFKIHLGRNIFEIFGKPYGSLVESATALLVLWLICLWMYRRRVFLRI